MASKHRGLSRRGGETAKTKRAGGRAGRLEGRRQAEQAQAAPKRLTRKIPPYNVLDEESLHRLEAQADWILREVGVEFFEDEESLRLFHEAGATVQGTRVRFDDGLVRSLCSTAPQSFTMHGRDSRYDITIGGDDLVFVPVYGPPFVYDMAQGRRYATLEDFHNIVKLVYQTPWLHHSGGTLCEPVDVAVNKRHLDMVYAHLRYSAKPFMGAVTAPERAEDSIEMARLVFGASCMETHCVIQGNINVNSPLVFDNIMTGALKAYARAGQGVVVSPFILGGAMGPVTMPALVAQAHAEAMAGIALAQLVRKGTPVVYGNFLTTMNLKTGAPTFGTAQANWAALAMGQLCRRLRLPLRCGGALTASKVTDGQAMQESASGMMAAVLAGANFVLQSAGWLEGGLTFGYEKFIIDSDYCAALHHFARGPVLDDNALAQEAYLEAGPGENFFGVKHTLENFADANYLSTIADTDSFEQWRDKGSETIEQRAHRQYQQKLADYQPPPIDEAQDEALQDFIARKKNAVPDMWY